MAKKKSPHEGIPYPWVMNDECFQIVSTAQDLYSLLKPERKEELLQEEKKFDRQISDILHHIEFSRHGVVEGYKIYKLLRSILHQRRGVKTALEMHQRFSQITIISKTMHKFLSSCTDGTISKIYSPREMPELFEKEVPCSLSPCSSESEIISSTNASSAMQ